ncbi:MULTISPECIES: hypothetical protein [unclassified Arthrobacter]|uniref:hypothetical protein n=1 Tax=unclassified Arthrobacter TaxID=235627 RepID=UPI00339A2C4D
MDAAEQSPAPDSDRSQKDLHRILGSHPTAAGNRKATTEHKPAAPQPNRRRRSFVVGGFAAAATAVLLIIPALSGGDAAFATWTAAPGELSGTERDGAVSDCLRSSHGVGSGMYSSDLAVAEVAIAEKRGAWTTVVLTGRDGFEATCTTDTTASWFNKGSFGSVGKPGNDQTLTARAVMATQLGTGVISNNPLSMASGRIGTDVIAITYMSAAGEKIKATVSKGQFAFWLPGDEITNSSDQNVPIEVTYSDNSTETQYLSL